MPGFQQSLEAVARRGRVLIEKKTTPVALATVLAAAVHGAESAIGDSVDGKTLPQFLEGVVLAFLAAPYDVSVQQTVDDWIGQQLLTVA